MKLIFSVILSMISLSGFSQNLVLGGLQGNNTLIFTPKGIITDDPKTYKPIGFKEIYEHGHSYELEFDLPSDWTFIAASNIQLSSGKKTNFFFYDSWVGCTEKIKTNGRKRDFPTDITAKISSNAYHIGIHREFVAENEAFIFIFSPKKQKVIVELPKSVFKTQRRLEYLMEANEAKFVHIILPTSEYTNLFWEEKPELRPKFNLKSDWDFTHNSENPFLKKGGAGFDKVNIPHVFDFKSNYDYRQIKDTLDITEMYKRGIGWYRKNFSIPRQWRDKYIRINFLAANKVAEVWLNGQYLGKHIGGYTDFHWGVNKHINWTGNNELIVKVDNRYNFDLPPHTADYNEQGGIYRDVEVMAWNPFFVKDIKITTPKVTANAADLDTKIMFNNKSDKTQVFTYILNLINPNNEIFETRTQSVTVQANTKPEFRESFKNLKNPLLWSPETPFIYKAVVNILNEKKEIIDQKIETFGFRFFEFDKDKGFNLNGNYHKLHGVNYHQEDYLKGWATDSASKLRDFLLMKEMGVNFIRMSHYPHHPYELYLADSLGIMLWSEIPVVNSVGKEDFIKNSVKMMEEMINRDKNHPSILMWGVGNEYYRDYFVKAEIEWALKCTQEVNKKVKELDPYRPTTQAQNDLADERIMKVTDLQGRNRYFGWYSGGKESAYRGYSSYDGFEKVMEIERKEHPEWKVIISEYGAEAKYGFHVNNPTRFDHSETYQLAFHKAYWEYIKKTDWIAGSTLWTMFDFTSFAKVGNIPHVNQKGCLTFDRRKKPLFYYYQSEWTTKPMIYIYAHNQHHRTDSTTKLRPLEVFSNCETVELFLNGKSQGKHSKSEGYVWNCDLTTGLNTLKVIGIKEGEVVKDSHQFYFSINDNNAKKTNGNDSD